MPETIAAVGLACTLIFVLLRCAISQDGRGSITIIVRVLARQCPSVHAAMSRTVFSIPTQRSHAGGCVAWGSFAG